jgi:hypothetical protein
MSRDWLQNILYNGILKAKSNGVLIIWNEINLSWFNSTAFCSPLKATMHYYSSKVSVLVVALTNELFISTELELRPLDRAACNQSLYWLCYRDSRLLPQAICNVRSEFWKQFAVSEKPVKRTRPVPADFSSLNLLVTIPILLLVEIIGHLCDK